MLFPEIDKEKTIQNVTELLSSYGKLCRLSGVPQQKMVATFSAEPFAPTGANTNEQHIFDALDYQSQLKEINCAIKLLNVNYQQLLIDKYVKEYKDYWIYTKHSLSMATYYRDMKKAKFYFAEAYKKGALLVYVW